MTSTNSVGIGRRVAASPGDGPRPTAVLLWSIKGSFVSYVERMRDGLVTLHEGTGRRDDGFVFAAEPSTDAAVHRFAGGVTFTGHNGMLALPIRGIEILEAAGTARSEGVLTIANADSPTGRCVLLRLGQPIVEGPVTRYAAPVLTEEGADLFFDNYRAGSPFDPIEILEGCAA